MDKPGLALCEHIQRHGYHSHLFSDITVSFQGKDYKLHRIILSQSLYFRSLLSGPWKESGKPRVELKIDDHNVTVEGLEIAFAYLYGVAPAFRNDNAVGVLGAGCFLCIENLCEQCVQFMVGDIREETFLGYQQLSERHCYGQHAEAIRDACWSYLCLHAARELLQVLSKLSLPLLCRLLKSDELWVTNESERYKLAKDVLLDWKLARIKPSNTEGTSSKRQRVSKSNSARKAAKTGSGKIKDKSSKNKDKSKKKAEASTDQNPKPAAREDQTESPLAKLRRIWEEDAAAAAAAADDAADYGFDMVTDLFCGGGIIFTYMNATEGLQARKELEDASMPTEVVNDAIWQNVLLKDRVVGGGARVNEVIDGDIDDDDDNDDAGDSDSDSDSDSNSDPLDNDTISSDSSVSAWSDEYEYDDLGNGSNNNNNNNNNVVKSASAGPSRNPVPFSASDEKPFDGKRRKTTGGFSWAAKLHSGMRMSDFPPFRFGTEFERDDDKGWYPAGEVERDVFFGGSQWKVTVQKHGFSAWTLALQCRGCVFTSQPDIYSDQRKVVRYAAKLYIGTSTGLQCVAGSGKRKSKGDVAVVLRSKDLPKDQLLRVVAVVQLIEDETKPPSKTPQSTTDEEA